MPHESAPARDGQAHDHYFLGAGHDHAERRTWAVIWLCSAMMSIEIAGGLAFGSIALVADGLHMSTHAGALLLAALAYSYARRHAGDPRFCFGTGKLGDLAGFTSAIVLAMIAMLIGYDAVQRFLAPVPIHFSEAIPIASLGLCVNVASAWLLGGGHDHGHGHGKHRRHGHHPHDHAHDHAPRQDHAHHGSGTQAYASDAKAHPHVFTTARGELRLSIHADDAPPRFRLAAPHGALPDAGTLETVRPDGTRRIFVLESGTGYLESREIVPEPHDFTVTLRLAGAAEEFAARFEEHVHGDTRASTDHNMRAALVHVVADALVSVLVIAGLLLARAFDWQWTDPLAGLIGAVVIASWSWTLARDTGAILLDMTPDRALAQSLRETIEAEGDRLTDFHVWRLGPGHLGAILSVRTGAQRGPGYYRAKLRRFRNLSHVTVEVEAD